ncbi:hypothetical protein BH11PSE3_BH11PSE3_40820 [soil metagenome]
MKPRLVNAVLVALSVALCTIAAELLVRVLDTAVDSAPAREHLDDIALAPGVDREWFFDDPPPLPNRSAVSEEALELVRKVERSGITEGTRRADMFKAWNANFAGDPCRHPYLRGAPGHLYLYDPLTAGQSRPPYRFLPNTTTPIGLVTNQYGFRGPPVPFARQPRTVRIAFIGASTTVGNHAYSYSYPEFIGHWLNRWAQARKLDVTFEALNAGRESITSSDNVVVVRDEVLPLKPDLLVYYEGANQFDLHTVVREVPCADGKLPPPAENCPARPASRAPASGGWLNDLQYESALIHRAQALLAAREVPGGGGEWPKPDYRLTWPADLDERDPDIGRPDLPVNLSTILGDLDTIRTAGKAAGAELVLASFIWLVKDGMVLDPIRHRSILEYLNQGYAPFHYRDLERLAAFENRVFAKYARAHQLAFIDVAAKMPFDPDLYIDAIHNNYAGERLRAWVFFQGLLPLVERHLASGAWPKAVDEASPVQAPRFTPRAMTFSCDRK